MKVNDTWYRVVPKNPPFVETGYTEFVVVVKILSKNRPRYTCYGIVNGVKTEGQTNTYTGNLEKFERLLISSGWKRKFVEDEEEIL